MNIKQRKSKKFRRGSILAVVLMIGICLAILGLAMLQMGFGSRVNSAISVSRITAREAADAGLRYALHSMNAAFPSGGAFPLTGSGTLNNSNASYSYEITIPPYAEPRGNYYNHYQIKSTGISDRGQRVIYAITGIRNLFDYGLIVTESLITKANSLIDGYDSRLGAYGVNGNSGGLVRVGTTSLIPPPLGGITLNMDVVITGDVLVAIGGKVDELIVDHGATTGPRYNMQDPFEFEKITPPTNYDIILPNPINDANSILGTPGITTYVKCPSINIPNGGVLNIFGNVHLYVTGSINLNNGAQIRVNGMPLIPSTWSSAMIYLDGDLNAGNSNGINNMTEKPFNFQLFGTGDGNQNWVIYNSGAFYGTYYAPNADIEIKSSGDIFGSVSGKSYNMKNAGNLHYDIDLSNMTKYDTGFGIDRWWEETGP
jgi:hypothetical protein